MQPFNVMALFCEDIREEKGELVTLVGLIPDNVGIEIPEGGLIETSEMRRFLTKLCAYIRINFDPDFDIGEPEMRLVMPDGEILRLGQITSQVVRKSQADAKANGNLLAGVLSKVVLAGFRPPNEGAIRLEVDINNETYLAGALMFRQKAK